MSISIRFSGFWKNSQQIENSFFKPLVEIVYDSSVVIEKDPTTMVDLEIFSVFPSKRKISSRFLNRFSKFTRETSLIMKGEVYSKSRKRIWYSGENKRAPLGNQFDVYLGYEPEEFSQQIHYLPLWVLGFDHFGKGIGHGFTSLVPNQDKLLTSRKYKPVKDKGFCCAFLGNPTSFRLGILRSLAKIENVGMYGNAFGNPVLDKLDIAEQYKFAFCFENNLYPGYVTEKLLEAYLVNCIPLYWGIDSSQYFNSHAFINLNEFDNIDKFIEKVAKVYQSEEEYVHIYEQPLLAKKFDMDLLITKLRNNLL